MASRYEVTELLDILGFQSGSMLVRGEQFWEVVLPPTEPSILANLGDGPRWLTPAEAGAGGGGFEGVSMMTSGSSFAQNAATMGTILTPTQNVEITHILYQGGSRAVGEQQRAGVVPMTGPVGAKVVDGEPVWSPPTEFTDNQRRFIFRNPLPEPYLMLAGQPYLLMVQRTDGSATDLLRGWYPNNNVGMIQNGPFLNEGESYIFTDLPIGTGLVPANSYAFPLYISVAGHPADSGV